MNKIFSLQVFSCNEKKRKKILIKFIMKLKKFKFSKNKVFDLPFLLLLLIIAISNQPNLHLAMAKFLPRLQKIKKF